MQNAITKSKKERPNFDFALREEKELYDYEFVVANIDRIVSDFGFRTASVGGDLYPYSEYAKIANVPDDVKDDWLWALYHFTSNLMVYYRGKGSLSAEDQTWQTVVTGVNKRFSAMLVERGLMSSPEEQQALIKKMLENFKKNGLTTKNS